MSRDNKKQKRKRDNKKQKSSTNVKSSKKDNTSLWEKAFKGTRDNEWNREDISVIIYWSRQVISFMIGIVWGMIRLEGMLSLLLYFIVCIFVLHSYKTSLNVSDDIFDIFDALKEGLVWSSF